jgi:hypothetical protein
MNDKYNQLLNVSNPEIVYNNLQKYFGRPTELYISNRKNKKYYIINPYNNKAVHFGSLIHRDYTFTRDKTKQKSYLARSSAIPGKWRDDKYSPNNISRSILWDIL